MVSLRKNFSFMVIGRTIYAATQWFLIIALARLTTAETLGDFTFALAITGPVIIFFQLNMRAYMATDATDIFSFSDYWATRILSVITAVVVIILAALLLDASASAYALILVVGLYKAAEAISDVYYGVLQKNELMAPIAISVAVRGITAVIAMILAVLLFDDVIAGAAGILVSWVILLIAYDMPKAKALLTREAVTHKPRVRELIAACFPMGLVLTLMSLRVNIPVYFIRDQLGSESVGHYSAVSYFLIAGALISGSLAQTTSPRLARLLHAGNKQAFLALLYKLLAVSALVGIIGVAVAYFFGNQILSIVYGTGYSHLDELLVIIMLAASANYLAQLLGMSLTVARLLWFQLFSNSMAALVVLLVAYLLVPSHGLIGGGIALLCGVSAALVFNSCALVVKLRQNILKA